MQKLQLSQRNIYLHVTGDSVGVHKASFSFCIGSERHSLRLGSWSKHLTYTEKAHSKRDVFCLGQRRSCWILTILIWFGGRPKMWVDTPNSGNTFWACNSGGWTCLTFPAGCCYHATEEWRYCQKTFKDHKHTTGHAGLHYSWTKDTLVSATSEKGIKCKYKAPALNALSSCRYEYRQCFITFHPSMFEVSFQYYVVKSPKFLHTGLRWSCLTCR